MAEDEGFEAPSDYSRRFSSQNPVLIILKFTVCKTAHFKVSLYPN